MWEYPQVGYLLPVSYPTLTKLLKEAETPTIPAPGPTWEVDPHTRDLVGTSLEHQILRSYRTRFNREWYEVRKLLDELQEMTSLTYDTATGFWAPYMRQIDQIESRLLTMQTTISKIKTLMMTQGIGEGDK